MLSVWSAYSSEKTGDRVITTIKHIIMDKMLPIPDNSLSQPSQYPKVTVGLFGYAVSSDLKLPSEFVKYSRIAAWSR